MTRSAHNPALAWFAALTALATVCLIGVGGLVTSHGVGMAVPDWPTTYGYNMFLFPISQWVGGIFYEHSHRLVASGVGFLVTILAVWLWLKEERRWLRRLGVLAWFAVVLQGVLGGLRVTMLKDELGIFHAMLAQAFLVLLAVIAFALSPWWKRLAGVRRAGITGALRMGLAAGVALVFLQLGLGATMRHQHSGLAVPDFPLAYGQVWPRTDAAFVEQINSKRLDSREYFPITAVQIQLHMLHRVGAVLLLAVAAGCVWMARNVGVSPAMRRWVNGWFAMILVQAGFGAWTVLSNKAADIATLHVVLGAISLVWISLLVLAGRVLALSPATVEAVVPEGRAAGAFS